MNPASVNRIAVIGLLTLGLAGPALADDLAFTREDLARAYLGFERAWREHRPPAGERAEWNRGADRAALAFLRGSRREMLEGFHRLTVALTVRPADRAAALTVRAFGVRADPVVAVGGGEVVLSGGFLFPGTGGAERLTVRIVFPDGAVLAERKATELPARVDLGEREPGVLRIEVAGRIGATFEAGRLPVVAEAPEAVRARNRERLARAGAEHPDLAAAIACARERNALLTASPSRFRSVEFLVDPARIAADLDDEISALAAGRDPYRRRPGSTWRVLDLPGDGLDYWIHAPAAACGDDPVPLVIALHGAGGDEGMFPFGYAAGGILDLAQMRGFLLVAPFTFRFTTRPEVFDRLVESLSSEYSIDPDRIYVLGHSMGAIATAIVGRARRDRIAAVCQIAGGDADGAGPPTLDVRGALDPLFPPLSGEAPEGVTRLVLPEAGHTLIVSAVLSRAVDWLLARRRGAR